jgi:hypothetical protein
MKRIVSAERPRIPEALDFAVLELFAKRLGADEDEFTWDDMDRRFPDEPYGFWFEHPDLGNIRVEYPRTRSGDQRYPVVEDIGALLAELRTRILDRRRHELLLAADNRGIPRRLVQDEMERRQAQSLVRETLEAEHHAGVVLPDSVLLSDLLREPDSVVEYRVEGLWPARGRVVLSAPMKSGKTTFVGNLLRALVDGQAFLEVFETVQVRRVVLIDTEMDRSQIKRWLQAQGIVETERVEVIPLRGNAAAFDLLDPGCREEWAARLRGADVLILDCLRPVLDALGLSEDKDAGRFLVAFDALLLDAEVDEGMIVHHTGHDGARSRGDSRLRDWPDAELRILRDVSKDQSPRYFKAFGRDVDVREGRLDYSPENRRLAYSAGENRANTFDDEVILQILDFVSLNPSCNTTAIQDGIVGVSAGEISKTLKHCRLDLVSAKKDGRALLHSITPQGEAWISDHSNNGRLVVSA